MFPRGITGYHFDVVAEFMLLVTVCGLYLGVMGDYSFYSGPVLDSSYDSAKARSQLTPGNLLGASLVTGFLLGLYRKPSTELSKWYRKKDHSHIEPHSINAWLHWLVRETAGTAALVVLLLTVLTSHFQSVTVLSWTMLLPSMALLFVLVRFDDARPDPKNERGEFSQLFKLFWGCAWIATFVIVLLTCVTLSISLF